jgi:CubicO group peptidase (beta-lactamase class C family)
MRPTPTPQYRIGSITKTFVAVEVLRLRDEGLLDLADPLGKHLPEAAEVADVTIAQLLSHTAGLAAEATDPWWERTPGERRPGTADLLGDQPRPHPTGRRFHYSNPGFALLGRLIDRLRDAPWDEVLEREVLRPLGMARTTPRPRTPAAGGWAVHPWADVMQPEVVVDTGRMGPAGQLWSTTADLSRWAAFLLDGDDQVLSAATLAEMREPVAVSGPQDLATSSGLGIQLRRDHGRTLFGHGGSMPGFVSGLWISADERLAGITLSNSTSAPAVGADLVRIVAEREPRLPDPWRPLPTADPELLALTGPWYWGSHTYLLRVLPDRGLDLSPIGGQGRPSRFQAEADGTWTGLDGYFARAATGGGKERAAPPEPGDLRVYPGALRTGRSGARRRRSRGLARHGIGLRATAGQRTWPERFTPDVGSPAAASSSTMTPSSASTYRPSGTPITATSPTRPPLAQQRARCQLKQLA